MSLVLLSGRVQSHARQRCTCRSAGSLHDGKVPPQPQSIRHSGVSQHEQVVTRVTNPKRAPCQEPKRSRRRVTSKNPPTSSSAATKVVSRQPATPSSMVYHLGRGSQCAACRASCPLSAPTPAPACTPRLPYWPLSRCRDPEGRLETKSRRGACVPRGGRPHPPPPVATSGSPSSLLTSQGSRGRESHGAASPPRLIPRPGGGRHEPHIQRPVTISPACVNFSGLL